MMFDSYCKTVIKNCARRYWKREVKRSEHEYLVADDQLSIYPTDKDAFAEKYIITCGNVQAIFHCFALFTAVKQLKEKEKTVVVLKYWGGYTDKYIAQYLSVTERTVRNLKSRAYIVCNAANTEPLCRLYQLCGQFCTSLQLWSIESRYSRTNRSRSYGCYFEMEG